MFASLVLTFWTLIEIYPVTESMQRLDVSRLLIRTSMLEFINKVIRVKVNKLDFIIRLTYELFDFRSQVVDSKSEGGNASTSSDESFIPPSTTSEEDEENLHKLEDDYDILMNSLERPKYFNV